MLCFVACEHRALSVTDAATKSLYVSDYAAILLLAVLCAAFLYFFDEATKSSLLSSTSRTAVGKVQLCFPSEELGVWPVQTDSRIRHEVCYRVSRAGRAACCTTRTVHVAFCSLSFSFSTRPPSIISSQRVIIHALLGVVVHNQDFLPEWACKSTGCRKGLFVSREK